MEYGLQCFPYGSVLGLLTSEIFVNELLFAFNSKCLPFADALKHCREDAQMLRQDLDALLAWSVESVISIDVGN